MPSVIEDAIAAGRPTARERELMRLLEQRDEMIRLLILQLRGPKSIPARICRPKVESGGSEIPPGA